MTFGRLVRFDLETLSGIEGKVPGEIVDVDGVGWGELGELKVEDL